MTSTRCARHGPASRQSGGGFYPENAVGLRWRGDQERAGRVGCPQTPYAFLPQRPTRIDQIPEPLIADLPNRDRTPRNAIAEAGRLDHGLGTMRDGYPDSLRCGSAAGQQQRESDYGGERAPGDSAVSN